jgi:acetolactate synthase-1/2/3 large subunit
MVMGELTTPVDLRMIVIVFADASLAPIEMKQRAVTYADTTVDFPGTDYAKVARALSGNGYICRSRDSSKALSRRHGGRNGSA